MELSSRESGCLIVLMGLGRTTRLGVPSTMGSGWMISVMASGRRSSPMDLGTINNYD